MDLHATGQRLTARRYLALVADGVIPEDERIELLDGVIVAMPPSAPPHSQGVRRLVRVLTAVLPAEIVISSQHPFLAGTTSVPEPDVAVLKGRFEDFEETHPCSAHLVVEVSDASLVQDRLTKSRIYAGAGIADYWIVNLREHVVEWYGDPDVLARVYRSSGSARGDDLLRLHAFPEVVLRAGDLLPPR